MKDSTVSAVFAEDNPVAVPVEAFDRVNEWYLRMIIRNDQTGHWRSDSVYSIPEIDSFRGFR